MQKLRYSKYFKTVVIAFDLLLVMGIFAYATGFQWVTPDKIEKFLLIGFVLLVYWFFLSGTTKIYHVPRNLTYTIYFQRLMVQLSAFLLGVFVLLRLTDNFLPISNIYYLGLGLLSTLILFKSFLFFALKYSHLMGINFRNIMFLDDDDSSLLLKETLENRKDYGFKIWDFNKVNFNVQDLIDFWKEKGIHTLFLPSSNNLPSHLEDEIFSAAAKKNVKIVLIPSITKNRFLEYDIGYIESIPILAPSKFPLELVSNSIIKRILDLTIAVLALFLICSWLFPIIAWFIKRDSKGPVFFIQKRYGKNDEVFDCIKFRTMEENEFSASKTTEINDSRITRIGKFLRRTSLDELPQLLNVLKGEMSIAGPRPHMLVIDDFYKAKIGRYSIRSKVKPGITGLAQVSGLRGDDTNASLRMKKRILADAFYVKNWSLSLDLVIILKTLYLILGGDKNAR